jgi:succinate dehydrogenase / fumarate reductase flavoprotein subunit
LADQISVPRFNTGLPEFEEAEKAVKERINKLMNIRGTHSVDHYHKELGKIMWEYVGMARSRESLKTALEKIKALKKEFWSDVRIPGEANSLNIELEKALRVADFFDIGYLMALDGLNRNESCGGHFRVEYQTPEGEALRNDTLYSYVSCWQFTGEDKEPELVREPLDYEFESRQQRNYKN